MAATTSVEGLAVLALVSIGLVLYGRAQNRDKPESGNTIVAVGALGPLIAPLWFLVMVLY